MQREKPGCTIEELEATLGIAHHSENMASGGQIENFREGWAHHIMSSSDVAHYFKRVDFETARSKCGVTVTVRWLYGRGNYPGCARCLQSKGRK